MRRVSVALASGLAAMLPWVPCAAQEQAPPAAAVPPVQADDVRRAERDALFRSCAAYDQSAPPTVDGARSRADCWQRMMLQGMGDQEVAGRFAGAQAAVDEARRAEEAKRLADSSTAATNQRLQAANAALRTRDLDDASSSVDEVLAIDPANPRALLLKDQIEALRRRRDQLRMLAVVLGAAAVLLTGLVVLIRALRKRHADREAGRAAADAGRKAVLKVVEGVGRGRLVTVEGELFRIGAAQSDRPEERNDFVLSDAEAFISRFHCVILRKYGRFFLVDSSLNGTMINGRPVERGRQVPLEDGDEVDLAGVSRLAFVRM